MFFRMLISHVHKKRHYQLHRDTLFQECFLSRSINSQVGFYRGKKPLGFASWLYTPINPSRSFIKHYVNLNQDPMSFYSFVFNKR